MPERASSMPKTLDPKIEEALYGVLVVTCYEWATKHMDQWEKFKLTLPGGRTLYVTITEMTDHPDSFDSADHVLRRPPSL
jgi:hypothetical protein